MAKFTLEEHGLYFETWMDDRYTPPMPLMRMTGKKQSIFVREGDVIGFSGLGTCWLIYRIHPNGFSYIDSDRSLIHFVPFTSIVRPSNGRGVNIILDCLQVTGWMLVNGRRT